jgi:hypothetical protein
VDSDHHGTVGYRQNFSFVTKEDGVRVRSGWLMTELGLREDGQDEVTICKVYVSPRAPATAANNSKKPAASGRKRKKADDASAPARQCRRRARRKTSEEEDHASAMAGNQEGLVEESTPEEPEVVEVLRMSLTTSTGGCGTRTS